MESPAKRGASVFPEVVMAAYEFTVAELAWHFRVARGSVGRWLSEDGIKGRPDPMDKRRNLYPFDAVAKSYEKRHAVAA